MITKLSYNNFFSLVGIGSKIQVDGLEETIAVVSSERSTGQNLNTNQVLKILLKLMYLMIHW